MFVNQKPVPITVGPNTITVKPKMDLITRSACLDALAAISEGSKGKSNIAMHLGAYQTALMQQNIVGWSGPAFVGIECTLEHIGKLDPDEPLVVAVLEEIGRRNPLGGETTAEKKELTNAGEPVLTESA